MHLSGVYSDTVHTTRLLSQLHMSDWIPDSFIVLGSAFSQVTAVCSRLRLPLQPGLSYQRSLIDKRTDHIT